jgi:lysophospholipase L1-like esterase
MLVRDRRTPILVSGVVTILIGGFAVVAGGSTATAARSSTLTAAADCSQPATDLATSGRPSALGDVSSLAAAPKVTVWMAGDSTMSNPSGSCPVGWGSRFGSYLTSDVAVVNSAVAGRSVQTWLYDPNVTTTKDASGECVISPRKYSDRWQAMLNGMKGGDYLLIQFGINDGSSTCARHVGSARYQELLGMMAAEAKRRGAQPIFLTPVAAITCSGATPKGNRGFLTETLAAGTAGDVPVIDLHKLSYTLYNTLRLCPNNGDYTSGTVGAFFCNDHTHFEAEGARQIAGLVAKALRDQGIGLASYLK